MSECATRRALGSSSRVHCGATEVELRGTSFCGEDWAQSDGVARIDLFLTDGERWPVPLKDNAFSVEVPRAKRPAELVAYDAAGRIVGITTE